MGSGLLTGKLLAGLVAAVVVIGGAAAVFALGGDDSPDAGDEDAAVAATGTPAAATTTEGTPAAESSPPAVVIDLDQLFEPLELSDGSTIQVRGLDLGDDGLAALIGIPLELLTGCFAVSPVEGGAFDLGELPCATINRIGEPARLLGNYTLSETAGSSSSSGGSDHAVFIVASDGSKISALRNDEATGERIPGDYFFAGAGPTHELRFGHSNQVVVEAHEWTVYPELQRQAAERLSQDSLDIQQSLQWLVFQDGTQLQAANLIRDEDGALETVFVVPPEFLQRCLQLITVPGTAFQVNGQGCLPVVGQVEEIQPDADLGPLGLIFVVPREDTVIAAITDGGVTATADLPPGPAPRKIRYGFRLEF